VTNIFRISGLILIIGASVFLKGTLRDYQVEKTGKIVKMQIIAKPENCLGSKTNHFVTLKYKKKEFLKKTAASFCEEHYVGEFIEVKHIEGTNSVILMNETVVLDIFSEFLMMIFAIVLLYKGFYKNKT
jgi:hypothetical protein